MVQVKRTFMTMLLFLGGVVLWLPHSIELEAVSNPTITISSLSTSSANEIENTIEDINDDLETQDLPELLEYDATALKSDGFVDITFDSNTYNDLDMDDKQEAMTYALSGIQNSDISATNRTKLYNFVAEQDSSVSSLVRQLSVDADADFASAYSKFQIIAPYLSTLLGLMVICIFTMLAFTVAFDLAFITIPFFQVMLMPDGTQHKKVKIVSAEAVNAVQQSLNAVGQNHVDALTVYTKSKFKQFICIGLCILYLASGEIYNFISSMMDYLTGFM